MSSVTRASTDVVLRANQCPNAVQAKAPTARRIRCQSDACTIDIEWIGSTGGMPV